MYQIDFIKPLVSQGAATQVMNGLMSQISAGVPSTGDSPTGVFPNIGNNVTPIPQDFTGLGTLSGNVAPGSINPVPTGMLFGPTTSAISGSSTAYSP